MQLQSHLRASLRLIPTNCHAKFGIHKKLDRRREAARHSMLLKTLLSYSSSCEMTPLSSARVSSY